MASNTEIAFMVWIADYYNNEKDCRGKANKFNEEQILRQESTKGKQKRPHLRTAIVPSWQWCQSIRLTGKGRDATEGARLEKEEKGRQGKRPPLLCKRKTKAAAKCLPKVQCLMTDVTIVSTQSIARRMHMRNFELWSFPRPVVLLHEPCDCRRKQRTWSIMWSPGHIMQAP